MRVPATNLLASYPFQVDVVSRGADPQSEFLQLEIRQTIRDHTKDIPGPPSHASFGVFDR
ncbi:hypothetical protein MPL3356_310039 [Mesorhizobium plurifarium]|uniref:Uncharacterized protein n=1 Tax=Mesorhizobium plurifarium TaxID=69974 RepID=A0A090DTJ9_MESPL|nr:hypothetical protein MPL3356_310039 [Mesorhizobium plurifarium]